MADVSQYRERPFSLTPGDLGFLQTLNVLAHEVGHQWLAEARYKVGEVTYDDLLGADGNHWSYLLDSDASLFYGADWRDNGDGTFTAAHVKERYSALDLYLMGLLPKEKVPPLRLLRNPAIDTTRINREGEVVTATGISEIPIDQLIAEMGKREPDWLHSQKEFRLGFVFLTKPGTEPSEEDLAAVEQVRRAFGAHFFALTHGVAWADTTLVETPSPPRAAAPDLQKALAWLVAQQGLDGSWTDAAETRLRDTAAAVWALATRRRARARVVAWHRVAAAGPAGEPRLPGAPRERSRAGGPDRRRPRRPHRHPPLRAERRRRLRGRRGLRERRARHRAWRFGPCRPSTTPADARVRRAVSALVRPGEPRRRLAGRRRWRDVDRGHRRGPARAAGLERGPWIGRPPRDGPRGAPGSQELRRWLRQQPEHAPRDGARPRGAAAVRGARRRRRAGDRLARSEPARGRQLGRQPVPDGVRPLGPAPVPRAEPRRARRHADRWLRTPRRRARSSTSRRASATPAARPRRPTVARLYDGDPASSPARGETLVPALAPGAEAEVAFDYPTQDRAGTRTLSVVADAAGSVRESREDDNTASLALTVLGRLADLVVGPADILVSPVGPEVGENVTITVTVHNAGERASSPAAVLVSVTDPAGAAVHLPPTGLPALSPGEAAPVSVAWTPGLAGQHVVLAIVDPRYDVPESDESNNTAQRALRAVESVPAGAALALVHASVTPSSLQELPQPIEVEALVENTGRTAARPTVAVIDGRSGVRLGAASVELESRSTDLLRVQGTVTTPGARQLIVIVDPDGEIAEEDETDNSLYLGFPDERTRELELSAASLSATDIEIGEQVTVSAAVRNRGTVDVLSIPVQVAHDGATGPVELVRTTVSLPAGESRVVELTWHAAFTGEAVPLLVRVDPFDIVVERREDDNAVPLTLRVRPSDRPNLAVSGADVTLVPDPPVEGEAATLSAVVRSTGVVPAGPFVVRFVVGDPDAGGTVIGEVPVDGLAGGESRTVSLQWSRVDVRGSLGLYVIADAGAAVEEANEDDNRAFRPFSAVGLPDLVLTAADVSLDPEYPRAGEAVTIWATVRNLGGRPSEASTTLAAAEGEADARVEVGSVPVPGLAPGAFATLSLPWTPAAPVGARPLSLVLDPEGLVTEQDEGNNEVARTVVVQDANLYLTEPVFSPDGDGVKDETTIAWRATGRVSVVVSNARGEGVRTLVEDGPESGSVTWDGRDSRGVVAWDGSYTVWVTSSSGQSVGGAPVVLDTNRSPIHDATPGRTTIRNLTCALPDYLRGPAWTAGEDEVLFVVPDARQGFPVGLLRVGLNGGHSYVAQDDWYRYADFASDAPVSPDGREVLLRESEVFLVDLLTGERRSLGSWGSNLKWSPDARFILAGSVVLDRDGSPTADLGWGEWVWSPGSDRLARVVETYDEDGNAITQVELIARDATYLDAIPLPLSAADRDKYEWVTVEKTVWRGDGKIVTGVSGCIPDGSGEGQECTTHPYLVDPDSRSVTPLGLPTIDGVWSPDGGRILFPDGSLYLESGTSLGPLLPNGAAVSPRATGATFWKWSGDTSRPGSVCGAKPYDTFVISSAANLATQLDVARLPGNSGLVVRGTVADRNLERFQLDYASLADPATWYPIGAALDVPVLDDVLTVWVPPGPGTYVIRLTASDRAGHSSVRTQLVSWERVPVLANFTQSDYYLSPDGDGIKDSVLFRYTVLSATRVDVRVVGPEPADPGDPAAREVWRTAFEHTTWGPESFSWDGKDASDQVVPDGRYTVHINDLPFRVEVDNTPPEIGLRFENLHPASAILQRPADGKYYPLGLFQFKYWMRLSSVAADRSWHVVDDRLKSWVFRRPERVIFGDTEPVFVPEVDPYGAPVLDGGRPRVRREAGRPVDRRDSQYVLSLATVKGMKLEAWDYAGNHAEVLVDPPPEALVPLGAVSWRREEILAPAVTLEARDEQGPLGRPVNALRPESVVIQAGSSLHRPTAEQGVRFVFEPKDGGASRELPITGSYDGHVNVDIDSFEALGVDPMLTYRGRFVGQGESGEVSSETFAFCPCPQWADMGILPSLEFDSKNYIVVRVRLDAVIVKVRAELETERIDGSRERVGTLDLTAIPDSEARRLFGLAPDPGREVVWIALWPGIPTDCANRLRVTAGLWDSAGTRQPSPDVDSACQKLKMVFPGECHFAVSLNQNFPGCSGSPDVLHVRAGGFADQPARVTIESGPPESPTIVDSFDFMPTPEHPTFGREYEVSVEGYAGETYPLRGRIVPHDPVFGDGASASLFATVDRAPPVGEILLPPEGGSVCLARDNASPPLATLARIDDVSTHVEVRASWRSGDGPWRPLSRVCDAACQRDPAVPTGRPFELAWNAAELDSGWYDLQVQFCDRAGNQGSTARRVLVTREPPTLLIGTVLHPVFSPNGDGRAEETQVTLRLVQPGNLSVRVHAESPQGSLVRTLWTDVPQTATDVVVSWDGRADDGKTVPNGTYALVFSIADACGGASERWTRVDVDTVQPEVEITEPAGGQRVSASVDVLGRATDLHFAVWELDLNCGASAEWTRLASRTHPVTPGSFLARWDTSRAPPGECRLRLAAEDQAENRSPEVFATATVERGELLEALSATPEIFSPNGDGRRETATLGYSLLRAGRVRLEVRDSGGHVLRTFETGELREAGAWSHVWDGLDDAGKPAAEGLHTLWVRAEDPDVATVYEEKTIRVDLDRTPPKVVIARPAPDGFASPASAVRGSVTDRTLAQFAVSVASAGSPLVELVRSSQEVTSERDLAPLSSLAEGPHALRVVASDRAENETQLDRPFQVDATPPRAAIQSPANGAFLRRGETPIPVTGLATDDHLELWALRFGAGAEPAAFMPIAQGETGGDGIALGPWDVRFVPDGVYTLSLVATDRAGLSTEARVTVTLDSLPPSVAIASPVAGGYVTKPGPIAGTATDLNLASWELESAPGEAAAAYQWSPLHSGTASVAGGNPRRLVAAAARRRLHAEADGARQGRALREHAGDGDGRHDAAGHAHRPEGEGHEGARGLRPRRRDVEPEHRAGPRRLPHRASERGVERGDTREPGVGRR